MMFEDEEGEPTRFGFMSSDKVSQSFIFANGGQCSRYQKGQLFDILLSEPTASIPRKISCPIYSLDWIRECQRTGKLVNKSKFLLSAPSIAMDKRLNLEPTKRRKKSPIKVKFVGKSSISKEREHKDPGPSNIDSSPVSKKMKTIGKVVYNRSRRYDANEIMAPSAIPMLLKRSRLENSPTGKAVARDIITENSEESNTIQRRSSRQDFTKIGEDEEVGSTFSRNELIVPNKVDDLPAVNIKETLVKLNGLEDFKIIEDLKFTYERIFQTLGGFSKESLADCLERSSGVLAPAVDLLKANFEYENVSAQSRKNLFTHEEDLMLLDGGFNYLVSAKGRLIVMDRLEYLGYSLQD